MICSDSRSRRSRFSVSRASSSVGLRLGKRLGAGFPPRVLGLLQLACGRVAQRARLLLFGAGALQKCIGLVPPPANVLKQTIHPQLVRVEHPRGCLEDLPWHAEASGDGQGIRPSRHADHQPVRRG